MNLLDDICRSIGQPLRFDGPTANRVYDKLFWGLNLPSVTPAGGHYVPLWSRREIRKLHQVITAGLGRLDAQLN